MILNLQISNTINTKKIPKKNKFKFWLHVILKKFKLLNSEITIRIVDKKEMCAINLQYRKKNIPTNLLSFPYHKIKGISNVLLGDIIVCNSIVEKEAKIFNKKIKERWAHIIVHGCLHLIGYQHNDKKKQKQMEKIEIEILNDLGYGNPYLYYY